MFDSISFAVEAPSSDHAINLFLGRRIKSWRKLMSHPASDFSLFLASIVSWGIGSFLCSGREHVSNARRGARLHGTRLSVPSMSTVREMRLLM